HADADGRLDRERQCARIDRCVGHELHEHARHADRLADDAQPSAVRVSAHAALYGPRRRRHRHRSQLHVPMRLVSFVAALLIASAPFDSSAQGGAKPIHLVVAFPAGGPTDFVGRVLATELSKELGQPVIVENKPGANGNIGADYVAKAPADGSVLFLTTVGAVAISPALYETLPYDPLKDFAPISLAVNNSTIFVVNPRNPPSNAAEFV